MEISESERMRLLEERLRQMEAALQGEGLRINSTPQAGTQTFRRSSSPEFTQTQPMPLTRQGAVMDLLTYCETLSQQTHANRGTSGPVDSHALAPICTRYEPRSGLSQVQTYSQPNGPPQPYQPFLGLQSLSTSQLPTSHVNQARRASAATMLHRRQNTRVALGNTRGAAPARAQRGPPRAADPAQFCYTEDRKIRVQVRVYPPDVSINPCSKQ